MPINRQDFDSISEQDLFELISTGVPEGPKLDYKATLYGGSDADIKEALKDISSFANSSGGHLVLGIEESAGLPIAPIVGIPAIDPDAQILRLEQLVRSGIEPRIIGLKIKPIQLANGNHVIVLRIPKSWNPPHRVSSKKTNRFYMRNSAGVHEASVEELRQLFTMASNIHENIRAFREQRLNWIVSGQGPLPLNENGRLILHIVPFSAFETLEQIDLTQCQQHSTLFEPMAALGGYSDRFNFEGFLTYRGSDLDHGYTQVFRTGIIEATRANFVQQNVDGRRFWSGASLGHYFFKALSDYMSGLKNIGVNAPFVIMLSLEGVKGTWLQVDIGITYQNSNYPIDRPVLYLPEAFIEEYGTPEQYQKALRPAFDTLWNTVGFAFSNCFNKDDVWVGR